MRLYTTTGATQVDDPEFGTFKADANGAFDGLPDAMYAKLHGRPGWENDPERELRITREELDRFRDPAELLKAVKELGANQGLLATALASALGLAQTPAAAAPEVAVAPGEPVHERPPTEETGSEQDPIPEEAPTVELEASNSEPAGPTQETKPRATRRGKGAPSTPATPIA